MNIDNKYLGKCKNFNKIQYQKFMVVNHVTAGDVFSSTADWFLNAKSQVSSNYVIDKDGTIYCFVEPIFVAWANGTCDDKNSRVYAGNATNKIAFDKRGNANNYSISIEVVDKDGKTATEAQIKSLCELNKYLYEKYICYEAKSTYSLKDIICGHFEVAPIVRPIDAKYLPLQKVRDYIMQNQQVWEYQTINCKVNENIGVMLKCDKVELETKGLIKINKTIYPYQSRKGDKGIYIEFSCYGTGEAKLIDNVTKQSLEVLCS